MPKQYRPSTRTSRNLPTEKELALLASLYVKASAAIEKEIEKAAAAGAAGTEAFFQARRLQIARIIRLLDIAAGPLVGEAIRQAYLKEAARIGRQIGAVTEETFASPQAAAIANLVENATARLGEAHITIGRRAEDAIRQISLTNLSQTLAEGQTVSARARALEEAYTKAGITFNKEGAPRLIAVGERTFSLADYARLVSRTTTREAQTSAVIDQMNNAELDLITISTHDGECDICDEYDGNTYSLNGTTPGYDVIDDLPPFHPNCVHVVTPAEIF